MKIVAISTAVAGWMVPAHGGINFVFLKLTTDEGLVGWGEASRVPFQPETVVKMIEGWYSLAMTAPGSRTLESK